MKKKLIIAGVIVLVIVGIVVLFKVLIGITVGFIVDLIYRKKTTEKADISKMCEEEHCSCDHDGIIVSSIKHTLKIGLFILIANLVINLIIFKVGEENLSKVLLHKNIFTYYMCFSS